MKYEPEKFSYIGQLATEPDVVIAKSDGSLKSYDDLAAAGKEKSVRFAATGPGSNEYVDPLVLGGETVFVCGSTGFADAATAALLAAGVPTHLIRVERFGPSG